MHQAPIGDGHCTPCLHRRLAAPLQAPGACDETYLEPHRRTRVARHRGRHREFCGAASAGGHTLNMPVILPLAEAATHLPARGSLIGLDLGTKTIGVASSDPDRKLATGVETI